MIEIVARHDKNAYRALYATKIDDDVYVLHVFQKKSPRKSETPKPDLETLDMRLKKANEIAAERREAAAAEAAKKGAR